MLFNNHRKNLKNKKEYSIQVCMKEFKGFSQERIVKNLV